MRAFWLWPVLLFAMLFAAGCDRPSVSRPGGTRVLADDIGRRVAFDGIPRRIVSLAPSLTESLFALGADSLLVGVTAHCNYPPEARTRTVVGDLLTPDVERILALKPDLVLISVEGNTQATFRRLEDMGVRLFVSYPRTLDGILASISDLAEITGTQRRGKRLVDSLRALRAGLLSHADRDSIRAVVLLSIRPLIAAGAGTFIDEILHLAGARNVAAAAPGQYPVLGREQLLLWNPAVMLFPDDLGLTPAQALRQFPEWRSMDAVRNGRMHALPADVLMRPGPRMFEALAAMHAAMAR